MLTAAGSGYSRWRDFAVTRWREDATCDDWGSYVYLRDVESDRLWSATYQPTSARPDQYSVAFSEERATFSRQDGDLHTTLEVIVSTEDDAEVRRLTITNNGERAREIEVTSYAEIAIAAQAADVAHPAFSKMSVETDYVARFGAILASRRRRSPDEPEIWAAHHSVASGESVGKAEFETDRARFLGRGLGVRTPAAAIDGRLLSRSTGAVLDPVFVLRRRVSLAPGAAARIDFWTLVAESREKLLDAVDRPTTSARSSGRRRSPGPRRRCSSIISASTGKRRACSSALPGISSMPAVAAAVLGSDHARRRTAVRPLAAGHLGRPADHPAAHRERRGHQDRPPAAAGHGILADKQARGGSRHPQRAGFLLRSGPADRARAHFAHQPGAASGVGEGATGQVFLLRADLMPPETRALLASVARVRLTGDGGGLAEQLDRIKEPVRPPARGSASLPSGARSRRSPVASSNSSTGSADLRKTDGNMSSPSAPASRLPRPGSMSSPIPGFGFQVSAEGSGFTWSVNSRENQLTPWSNDPVTDRPGEAIYLRDEDSGELWCPTALPIRDDLGVYVARHGWGYSRFEHEAHGIAIELLTYVPVADPIKISRLKLRNATDRPRRLSVTAYVEWVLGTSRGGFGAIRPTEIDPDPGPCSRAIRGIRPSPGASPSSTLAAGRRAGRRTAASSSAAMAACPIRPASPERRRFPARSGAGLDPCGAMGTTVELPPDAETEIVILLGEADGPEQAAALIARYRDADLDAVLAEVREQWDELLGTVQVKTPDRSMDIMLNGWLLYQTLACRIWARSGFYQASGAYGFRDQLQDGMALAAIRPSLTREHLLRAAGRQFAEGDVQHWWLPHSGQGVRTRISDDRVWLAFASPTIVETTGDAAVLDEVAPFLEGPALKEGEDASFFPPDRLGQKGERLRALRARPRREPCARRPRAAADRQRRLERRHEPRRRGRQGRKRLARLAFCT